MFTTAVVLLLITGGTTAQRPEQATACEREGATFVGSQPSTLRDRERLPKKVRHVAPRYPELPPGTCGSGMWIGEVLLDARPRDPAAAGWQTEAPGTCDVLWVTGAPASDFPGALARVQGCPRCARRWRGLDTRRALPSTGNCRSARATTDSRAGVRGGDHDGGRRPRQLRRDLQRNGHGRTREAGQVANDLVTDLPGVGSYAQAVQRHSTVESRDLPRARPGLSWVAGIPADSRFPAGKRSGRSS